MKKIIFLITVIFVLAGSGKLISNRLPLAKDRVPLSSPSTSARSQESDSHRKTSSGATSSTLAPGSLEKTAPQESITKISSGTTIYKNYYYGIELSYPSAFGDVIAQPDEFIALPFSDKGPGECKDRGQFFHKGFSRNRNLDFGLISINYKNCSVQKHSIFDANKASVSGNTLILTFWNSDPLNVPIGKVVPLPNSNGIDGYIIKNFIGNARGETAAVIPTPGNNLGPLIFRISNENGSRSVSYEQGVELLEQIISQ